MSDYVDNNIDVKVLLKCSNHFDRIGLYACSCDANGGKCHCRDCIEDFHSGDGHKVFHIESDIDNIKQYLILPEIKPMKEIIKKIDEAAVKYNDLKDEVNFQFYSYILYLHFNFF